MSIEKFKDGHLQKEIAPFTILNNKVIDILDPFSLGVYVKLQKKPNDWKIIPAALAKECNCGMEKIYKILKKLQEEGLLERQEIREKGQFKKYVYKLFYEAKDPMVTEHSPLTEKPYTEKPHTVNQGTYKINKVKNKEITKKEKINKKEKVFLDLEDLELDNPFFISKEKLKTFIAIRKEKKKKVTSETWKRINNTLSQAREEGFNIDDCFNLILENCWSSLKIDWIRNSLSKNEGITNTDIDKKYGNYISAVESFRDKKLLRKNAKILTREDFEKKNININEALANVRLSHSEIYSNQKQASKEDRLKAQKMIDSFNSYEERKAKSLKDVLEKSFKKPSDEK